MTKNLQYLSIFASTLILISLFLFSFLSKSSLDTTTVFAQISNNALNDENQVNLDNLSSYSWFSDVGYK